VYQVGNSFMVNSYPF